jgi:hypothetical protein
MNNIAGWCFRMAVIYALFGMVMGEVMAATGDHGLMPVHAHINLLGWVSLALFGAFYKLWPETAEGSLPGLQFGLFNAGIVIQSIGVTLILTSGDEAERYASVAAGGSAFLILGMLLFGFLVYRNTRE